MLTTLAAATLLQLPVALPPGAYEATFESDGVPIRFVEAGEGDVPLVLVHGFAASLDAMLGAGLLETFGDEHRVIAIDARGHGESGKPHDQGAYGLTMVDDVVRLLDHVGAERAHVLGYSMGGMIALKLAQRHPDRLLSVVAGGYGWPRVPEDGERLMDRVADALAAGEGFGPLFPALTPRGSTPPPPEAIGQIERAVLAVNDAAALAAAARGFRELELDEARMRANEVPTLAVVGELDPLRPDVERMDGVLANLEIVVIPGADHGSTGGTPAFRAAVRAFLAAHRPAPAEPAGVR